MSTLPTGQKSAYVQGMERDTMPPTTDEAEGVGRFETQVHREGDFWAYVRQVARVAGIVK